MVSRTLERGAAGPAVGWLATLCGLAASVFLLFGPTGRYETWTDGTRVTGTTAGIDYLLGAEHADPALFAWALVVLALSLLGGYGVRVRDRHIVWMAGLLLLGVAIVAILSIGFYVAPAAILFLAAGLQLSHAHRGSEQL